MKKENRNRYKVCSADYLFSILYNYRKSLKIIEKIALQI